MDGDIKILLLSPFSSIVYAIAFVRSTHNTNIISWKLFVALSVYQAHIKNSKDELRKEYSNTLDKQVIHHLFAYKAHCLSFYQNSLIVTIEQVVIRQYYA